MKQPYSRASKVAKVIQGAMIRNGIESQKALSEYTGIKESSISKRFSGKPFWSLLELWVLDGVLHFTPEEWLAIKGCGKR